MNPDYNFIILWCAQGWVTRCFLEVMWVKLCKCVSCFALMSASQHLMLIGQPVSAWIPWNCLNICNNYFNKINVFTLARHCQIKTYVWSSYAFQCYHQKHSCVGKLRDVYHLGCSAKSHFSPTTVQQQQVMTDTCYREAAFLAVLSDGLVVTQVVNNDWLSPKFNQQLLYLIKYRRPPWREQHIRMHLDSISYFSFYFYSGIKCETQTTGNRRTTYLCSRDTARFPTGTSGLE